jgi:transcriptional regulator of arginine metabolism
MGAVKEEKDVRQRVMLDLIRHESLHTQQELAQALVDRGHSVTQTTISRDIQELGLVRTAAGYQAVRPATSIADLVLRVAQVEFLLVIHTPPGTASLVARAIDDARLAGVAGTLAGDDTIIVVLASPSTAESVRRFLSARPN